MDTEKEKNIRIVEELISNFEKGATKVGVHIYNLRKEWEGFHKPRYLLGEVDEDYILGLIQRLQKHDVMSLARFRNDSVYYGSIFYTGYTKG